MNDGVISTCKVVAATLWVWTLGVLVAAWFTAVLGGALWVAGMLAATACVSSAVAATAQIRCYTFTVCGQLRMNRAAIERVEMSRPESLRGV